MCPTCPRGLTLTFFRAWSAGGAERQIAELQSLTNCRLKVRDGGEGLGGAAVEIVGSHKCVDKAKALIAYTLESIQEDRDRQVGVIASDRPRSESLPVRGPSEVVRDRVPLASIMEGLEPSGQPQLRR